MTKREQAATRQTRKRIKTETAETSDVLKREVLEVAEKSDISAVKVKIEVKQEQAPANVPNYFRAVSAEDLKLAGPKAPKKWHEIYDAVAEMRAKIMTPVDTMGCERIPTTMDFNVKEKDPQTYRFQLLIALMLSSQTKDEVNFAAMVNLQKGLVARGFEKGLTLEGVLSLTPAELDGYIKKIGFHNRKTVYILNACRILKEKHNSDIPKTIEEIVALPGVGPKMGHLLLQRGWNIVTGIGVDVHIHRLAKMWGWVKNTENPEVTRKELEDWLPQTLWADLNPLLVGFGQVVCTPQSKNCDICTLGRSGLCKGVDRKRMRTEMTPERAAKLAKGRADVSALVVEVET